MRTDAVVSPSPRPSPRKPGEGEAATTFSLIVLSYQSGRYIERCLAALEAFDAEIVLADNGSGDLDWPGLKARFPKVKLLPFGDNLGFAAGNNRAAKEATGEWLGFINPDAFADAGWLDAMQTAVHARPDIAIFTSLQLDAENPAIMDGAGDGMTFFGFPFRMGYRRPLPSELKPAEVLSPCGAAFVIRRDLWDRLGGFDERYFCYCEDADLGQRAFLLGHPTLFVPDAKVAHIGSATFGARSDFALWHGYRNRPWLYLKTMPLALLWWNLPVHIAITLAFALKDTLKGRGGIVWPALWASLEGMGPILKTREHVQKSRTISALRLAKFLTWNPVKIALRDVDHRR